MRYAGEKRFNIWTVLTLILLAMFLLFVIYPIGMLLTKSLFTGGSVDLSYFVKFFTKQYYGSTLVNSFKVTPPTCPGASWVLSTWWSPPACS